jgi:hypothetical protein
VELFNALNYTNFSVPDRTAAQIFTQTFAPVAAAGLLRPRPPRRGKFNWH